MLRFLLLIALSSFSLVSLTANQPQTVVHPSTISLQSDDIADEDEELYDEEGDDETAHPGVLACDSNSDKAENATEGTIVVPQPEATLAGCCHKKRKNNEIHACKNKHTNIILACKRCRD